VDENGSKDRAALTLGITKRQVNRLIKSYKEKGKAAFIHGNRGRKPSTTTPEQIRQDVLDLYRNKYYDTNFVHFTELLRNKEKIKLSVSCVTGILESENILSPKVTKQKKKRIKRQLEEEKKAAKNKPSREERGYTKPRGRKDDWMQFLMQDNELKGDAPDFNEDGWAKKSKKK